MTQQTLSASQNVLDTVKDFFALCKPRVTALIVFTGFAGMIIAAPDALSVSTLLGFIIGLALVSASAASLNGLLEIRTDAKMERTQKRPLPSGRLSVNHALAFTSVIALMGLGILYAGTNALTLWLTLASFFGYAVIYTVFLKPHTSQNIVIGGIAGAMPPVLGWSAVSNGIAPEAWILFAIIFIWTPPHFWSLALYYREDYKKGGFPMLPVTRGVAHTQLNILAYTVTLVLVSALPFVYGLSGVVYLFAAAVLGALFLHHAIGLFRSYSDVRTMAMFRFSIVYLFSLFSALIVDQYLIA